MMKFKNWIIYYPYSAVSVYICGSCDSKSQSDSLKK